MHPTELHGMTLEALRALAARHELPGAARLGRDELIEHLAKALEHPRDGAAAQPRPARRAHDQAGPPAPPAHPDTRPVDDTPETMARLYLEQGQPERAAALYRELLALRPDDATLQARIDEAESELRRARGTHAPSASASTSQLKVTAPTPTPTPSLPVVPVLPAEPLGMLDFEELPEAYGVDECELIAKDPFSIFVYWEVTEAGLGAARLNLGDEGTGATLVMRLFSTTPRGERGPERETRDAPLEGHRGRRYLPATRPGARLRAAVGLLAPSGLFQPLAESSLVRVPPAEPAPQVAREWMEVEPPRADGAEAEAIVIKQRTLKHAERGFVEVAGLPHRVTPEHVGAPSGPVESAGGPGGSSRPSSGPPGGASPGSESGRGRFGSGGRH